MTISEVRRYYGRKYRDVLDRFLVLGELDCFQVDPKCDRYLELYINTDAVRRNHFNFHIKKINHGMNNKINMWFDNKPSYESTTFKSQSEAGRYIQRCL